VQAWAGPAGGVKAMIYTAFKEVGARPIFT
jgi:hypothetical protein